MNNNAFYDSNDIIPDELKISTNNNNINNNKIIIYDDLKNEKYQKNIKIIKNTNVGVNNNFNKLISSTYDDKPKNFDHINWNKYLSNKEYNFEYLIYKNNVISYFSIYTKKEKDIIKKKLLGSNTLNLLIEPFNINLNNLILSELDSQVIKNLKKNKLKRYNKINDIEIITYCLYFLDSSEIEKIHWSYFSLEYFFIFFEKINNLQKIIEIINWNYIYNSNNLKIFELIFHAYTQTYKSKNIIIYDYLYNLNLQFNLKKKYNLINLPKTYNNIINLIEKKNVLPKKINYNDNEIIENILTKSINDKSFNKIINMIDKNKLINWISENLCEQNISENKIIKILELFDDKNKKNHNSSNIKLFCKFLVNGYVYCIKKVWHNKLPKFNKLIEKIILEIIKKDNDKIFKALLKENILHDYLYCTENLLIWANILFKCNKIPNVLVKDNYDIPKNVILKIISLVQNKKYRYSYKNFYSIHKISEKNNIFLKNIELFDFPINNNTIPIIIEYTNDDYICKWISNNIDMILTDKINMNLLIGLILSRKKFNLLDKIFKIKPEIFNKEIYCKNLKKYCKYFKNPKTIGDVYLHNINKYKQKITKSMAIISLKFKKYNLVKKIIKKNNIFTLDLIKSYFFTNKYNRLNNLKNFNKIFNILKININNWNELYNNTYNCEYILRINKLDYNDFIFIYEKNKNNTNIVNKLLRVSIDNFTIEQKINILRILLDDINSFEISNSNQHLINKFIIFLDKIDFDEFIIYDKKYNLSEKIKKNINFKLLIDCIYSNIPGLNFFKYANYFGYFIPNSYLNTLIIINYLDQNTSVVEYYLSKCNFIREKTYNYVKDYITNNLNCYRRRKMFNINNSKICQYTNINKMIDIKNIIYKTSNIYEHNIQKEIGDNNYDVIKNIKVKIDWLYYNFDKNSDNDILSEL